MVHVEGTTVTDGFQVLTLFPPGMLGVIHTLSSMHVLLRKSQTQCSGLHSSVHAPIAKTLNQMSEGDKKTLRIKFDIAHFVALQRLALTNYPAVCWLEAKDGVDVWHCSP